MKYNLLDAISLGMGLGYSNLEKEDLLGMGQRAKLLYCPLHRIVHEGKNHLKVNQREVAKLLQGDLERGFSHSAVTNGKGCRHRFSTFRKEPGNKSSVNV